MTWAAAYGLTGSMGSSSTAASRSCWPTIPKPGVSSTPRPSSYERSIPERWCGPDRVSPEWAIPCAARACWPFGGAGVHAAACRERPVGELPGRALDGAELAVDADHADAPMVDRPTHLVAFAAGDLRSEPFPGTGHQRSSIGRLSEWIRGNVRGSARTFRERNRRSEGWATRDSNPEPTD